MNCNVKELWSFLKYKHHSCLLLFHQNVMPDVRQIKCILKAYMITKACKNNKVNNSCTFCISEIVGWYSVEGTGGH